jgi:hypothetical protein
MCGSGYSGEKTSKKQSRDTTYTNQKLYRKWNRTEQDYIAEKKEISKSPKDALNEELDEMTSDIKKKTSVMTASINAKTAAMRNELVNKKRLNYFGTQYNIIEGADESTPSLTGGIGVSSQKIVKLG